MYQFQSRVRYSETDVDARLSLAGMMNYMQDCSTFQSEDGGVGLSWLKEHKKAWLLSAWHIVFRRRPGLGEEITVATWPYSFKGIYGLRNFTIRDRAGAMLVMADSCWFLCSTETGKPVRVLPEDVSPYGGVEPRLPMEEAGRKIALPAELTEAGRMTVLKHQIDTNHHVNNVQYVDIARELLPGDREIRELRAEYRKAAVLGDEMVLMRGAASDRSVVSMQDAEGKVFANVEFKLA